MVTWTWWSSWAVLAPPSSIPHVTWKELYHKGVPGSILCAAGRGLGAVEGGGVLQSLRCFATTVRGGGTVVGTTRPPDDEPVKLWKSAGGLSRSQANCLSRGGLPGGHDRRCGRKPWPGRRGGRAGIRGGPCASGAASQSASSIPGNVWVSCGMAASQPPKLSKCASMRQG